MKQIVIVALAAGALVLGLAGCGSDKSTEAGGQHKDTSTSAATSSAPATTTTAVTVVEPPAGAPVASTVAAKKSAAPDGAQTTCGDFRDLDGDTEKQVIQQVLAANPGSKFEGSPNVALGTAKLVCLAQTYANTPVANAIGATK